MVFLLIAYLHLPIWVPSISSSIFVFLFSQVMLWICYQIETALAIFFCLFPFNLYATTKSYKIYSDAELQFFCFVLFVCFFSFVCLYISLLSCSVMSDSLQPFTLWPVRLFNIWDFSGKNTGVGYHLFLRIYHLTESLMCI